MRRTTMVLELCVITLLLLLFTQCNSFPEEEKFNVLFIAVDDLRPELNCYGADHVQSPNIDQLASESVVFDRAYCNIPVCGASRASLLTGMRPTMNRLVNYYTRAEKDFPQISTLPEHLRDNGYFTASAGKVFHHFDDCIEDWDTIWDSQGISSWRDYVLEENIQLDTTPGKHGPFCENADVADDAYRDGKCAMHAIRSLAEMKEQDQPFFFAVGLVKPHLPFNAPRKYWDMYNSEDIDVPPAGFRPSNAPRKAFHNFGELRAYKDVPESGPVEDTDAQKLIHGYYAATSYVDAQIGKILEELKRLDLEKNTIVVLLGDHGWNLRDHGLWCKHCNFETSLHVPLMVKIPGKKAVRTNEIVEYVDIYPSLCDLLDVPLPEHLEGASFAALAEDPNAKTDGVAVSKYHGGVTVVTDQYFYTEWLNKNDEISSRMLYDHQVDKNEMNNISELPENAKLIDSLSDLQRKHRGDNFMDEWDERLNYSN
jgi:iduronate 2-sulfatase